MLCHQLEQLGHDVVSCNNATVALAVWKKANRAFDLTITACTMPLLDGFELTRRIRDQERERAQRSHSIFGMTDNARPALIDKCLSAGMNHCLRRPIAIEALMPLIAEVTLQSKRRALAAAAKSGGELHKIKLLSPEVYVPLVNQILRCHREDAVKLAQADTFEELARLAHKLLGGAQLADERALIEACNSLQDLTSQGSMQMCKAQVTVVLTGLQKLEDRLLQDCQATQAISP